VNAIGDIEGTAFWMFVVAMPSPIAHLKLPEIIAGIQEVQLMLEPA
jgi:hypothetical protein